MRFTKQVLKKKNKKFNYQNRDVLKSQLANLIVRITMSETSHPICCEFVESHISSFFSFITVVVVFLCFNVD